MIKRPRTWTSLASAALAGTALASLSLLSACGPGEGEGGEGGAVKPETAAGGHAGGHGGEGEGEGEGEGGGKAVVDLASDDIAYLTRLGLIRGHLHVGMELFRAGEIEMAKTHMKHPQDELYAAMLPAFEARNAAQFDEALTALAVAVESGAATADVESAYAAVTAAISAAEGAIGDATKASLKAEFAVASALLRESGREYAIGVVDGAIANLHEYQDAWGFYQTSRARIEGVPAERRAGAEAVFERALAELKTAEPLFAGIAAPSGMTGDAGLLHAIAARLDIEAAALPN